MPVILQVAMAGPVAQLAPPLLRHLAHLAHQVQVLLAHQVQVHLQPQLPSPRLSRSSRPTLFSLPRHHQPPGQTASKVLKNSPPKKFSSKKNLLRKDSQKEIFRQFRGNWWWGRGLSDDRWSWWVTFLLCGVIVFCGVIVAFELLLSTSHADS